MKYTYKLTENGYYIFIDGIKTIYQYEPYIPYRGATYEESAKLHIAELEKAEREAQEQQAQEQTMDERITALELAMIEQYERGAK